MTLFFVPKLVFVFLGGGLLELRFQALLFVPLVGGGHRVVVPLQVLGSNALLAPEQVLELLLVFLGEAYLG